MSFANSFMGLFSSFEGLLRSCNCVVENLEWMEIEKKIKIKNKKINMLLFNVDKRKRMIQSFNKMLKKLKRSDFSNIKAWRMTT
jgi:carbonic anhydrase